MTGLLHRSCAGGASGSSHYALNTLPEMTSLLADPGLYAFIGQVPPTALELEQRYRRQTAGRSPDDS